MNTGTSDHLKAMLKKLSNTGSAIHEELHTW